MGRPVRSGMAELDVTRCTRKAFLAHQIRELELLASASSTTERQPGAAVAARKLAAELRVALDEASKPKARQPKPRKGPPRPEDAIAEVRRLRVAASHAGSFVAAANLLQLEVELEQAADARRKAEEQERLAHMTEGEMVARLVATLARMPAPLRARVLEAVAAPVN